MQILKFRKLKIPSSILKEITDGKTIIGKNYAVRTRQFEIAMSSIGGKIFSEVERRYNKLTHIGKEICITPTKGKRILLSTETEIYYPESGGSLISINGILENTLRLMKIPYLSEDKNYSRIFNIIKEHLYRYKILYEDDTQIKKVLAEISSIVSYAEEMGSGIILISKDEQIEKYLKDILHIIPLKLASENKDFKTLLRKLAHINRIELTTEEINRIITELYVDELGSEMDIDNELDEILSEAPPIPLSDRIRTAQSPPTYRFIGNMNSDGTIDNV